MAKRIKSEIEKQYITRIWNQRKRYLRSKEEYDKWGCWADGESMRKAKRTMNKLRNELAKVRAQGKYRIAA